MTERKPRPEISVIIPVYNTEKYLRECLDSVLAQTFTDFELILIDDGSTDGSPAICDAYAERDHRIRVFHQENQGQAAARNFGVTQAGAERIAFVDSDDVVHPQYLEILLRGLREDARISMCDNTEGDTVPAVFYKSAGSLQYESFTVDEKMLLRMCGGRHRGKHFIVWGKLIDKSIPEKLPFAEGRIHEDVQIVCQWLAEAGKVSLVEWEGYFYRNSDASTMRREFTANRADLLWATKQQVEFYKNLGYTQMELEMAKSWFLNAPDIYNKFLTVLKDREGAKAVRSEFLMMERKYWKEVDLPEQDRGWISATFHPAAAYVKGRFTKS